MAQCSSCSQDNPPGSARCGRCGAPLSPQGWGQASSPLGYGQPPAPYGQPLAPYGQQQAQGGEGFLDPERPSKLGVPGKFAAAFCYFPLCWCFPAIASIVLLAAEDKQNKFVRFHAMQSLAAWIGLLVYQVVAVVVQVIAGVLQGVMGHGDAIMILFVGPVVLIGLAMFGAMCACVFFAASGKIFKLPLLGEFAAKQAGL